MRREVLVAGVANVRQGDDAFGVEVVRHLLDRPLPDGVRAQDLGIRGVHLACELLDGYTDLILVDAVSMGEAPTTLALIEPDGVDAEPRVHDAHSMNPDAVLAPLAHSDVRLKQVLVVGCQPASLTDAMGLTPLVAAAVDPAVDTCARLITDLVEPAIEENE